MAGRASEAKVFERRSRGVDDYDSDCHVDLGCLSRKDHYKDLMHIPSSSTSTTGGSSRDSNTKQHHTTEPGQHQPSTLAFLLLHGRKNSRARNGRNPDRYRPRFPQSMDDAHLAIMRPSQTSPSTWSPHTFDTTDQRPRHQQRQHQQRLRQGSLASDWRFPSMPSPTSPHSLCSQANQPTSPQAQVAAGARSPSSSPSGAASVADLGSSPTSPRRRRDFAPDFALQPNTDPLVHHRLISPDPVNNTRTLLQSKTRAYTADSYHTSPPDHSRSHPNFSSFSQSRSQHHQAALPPAPQSPRVHTHHGQFAPVENDGAYAYPDLEQNGGSAYPLAVDHHQSVPSENQFCESPAQNSARSDRQFLPISPVSPTSAGPRWESLPLSRDKNTTLKIDAPLSPDRVFPPSPSCTPRSPLFLAALHSHPYIPEDKPLDLHYESETTARYEHAGPVTTTMSGHIDRMYRPDSRMSGDTAYSADNFNFSRPRKPSLKSLNAPDFAYNMALRPSTAKSTASDSLRFESRTLTSSPYSNNNINNNINNNNNNGNNHNNNNNHNTNNMPYMPYQQSRPRRQPSVGSTMSSSTYTSVGPGLRHHASQDVMSTHRNVSQNAAAGNFVGLPHNVRPQAPPRHYNRGGPPAQQQQSHLYEDEMRSSVKSQLTTSTAQETLFSEPERSSVLTKTSSVFSSSFRNTRQSSFFGPHAPVLDVRDSLSVDDVMGMYETGFNDSEMDLARRMSGMDMAERIEASLVRLTPDRMDDHDDSRPGTAMSHNGDAANRLLEAMSQTGPLPIPGRSFPLNGDSPVILPDTKAFFRKSLARSIPKDMRLSYISTKSRMDGVYGYDDEKDDVAIETDSARHSRHDSGKMVDPRSEENSPIEDPEKDITLFTTEASSEPIKASLSPPPSMAVPTPAQPPPSQNIQGALQPEDLDPDANDRYGFRKQNQYVTRQLYDEWNGPYTEYLARRRRKWEAFLKENGLMTDKPNRFPQHSAKAKRFVRKGIPPDWRGAAWFYYAGGPKILANNRGVYDQMLKRVADGGLKEVCREDIERDLYRTFPDNVRFKRGATAAATGHDSLGTTPAHSRNNSTQSANPLPRAPGSEPKIIDQLRRVLSAFAIFNPSIGYCQSLNFLGGMLLLFVESEEQAFWLLNIITRVYLPGTHEMNLEGSKVDLSVLMAELQTTLPGVWVKISDDGSTTTKKKSRRGRHRGAAAPEADNLPPVTLALTAWFMSCFIGTLPTETTLRVWDVFFYEGSKTLFRVALAIFKAGENEIKAINDPMEVFAVVQTLPRKMLDANLLMETCFKRRSGLNHITSEEIDRSRTERREKLHVEQREKVAAAQAGPGLQTVATMVMNRKPSDLLSVDSEDGVRRKHHLFGRRALTGNKERSGIEV